MLVEKDEILEEDDLIVNELNKLLGLVKYAGSTLNVNGISFNTNSTSDDITDPIKLMANINLTQVFFWYKTSRKPQYFFTQSSSWDRWYIKRNQHH